MVVAFFFFFSSRRRHTRFDCDWSSDVCSSDLGVADVQLLDLHVRARFDEVVDGVDAVVQALVVGNRLLPGAVRAMLRVGSAGAICLGPAYLVVQAGAILEDRPLSPALVYAPAPPPVYH